MKISRPYDYCYQKELQQEYNIENDETVIAVKRPVFPPFPPPRVFAIIEKTITQKSKSKIDLFNVPTGSKTLSEKKLYT